MYVCMYIYIYIYTNIKHHTHTYLPHPLDNLCSHSGLCIHTYTHTYTHTHINTHPYLILWTACAVIWVCAIKVLCTLTHPVIESCVGRTLYVCMYVSMYVHRNIFLAHRHFPSLRVALVGHCMYVCMYVCMYIGIYSLHIGTHHTHTHTGTSKGTSIHTYIHIHTYMYVCMYVCIQELTLQFLIRVEFLRDVAYKGHEEQLTSGLP